MIEKTEYLSKVSIKEFEAFAKGRLLAQRSSDSPPYIRGCAYIITRDLKVMSQGKVIGTVAGALGAVLITFMKASAARKKNPPKR